MTDINEDKYAAFEKGFIDTALWLAERECDWGFFDITDIEDPDLRDETQSDLEGFFKSHHETIEGRENQAGHDFYLTRYGHGAGFWDGDWPRETGQTLTKAAHAYGSTDALDRHLKGEI